MAPVQLAVSIIIAASSFSTATAAVVDQVSFGWMVSLTAHAPRPWTAVRPTCSNLIHLLHATPTLTRKGNMYNGYPLPSSTDSMSADVGAINTLDVFLGPCE